MMQPGKFFIIGCARSGTTLLRLILESHSKIACLDEPNCYQTLAVPKKLENTLLQNQDKKWVGFKIPRFAEQLDAPTIYDYGTPNVFPIANFYQNEPLIFIVRDVRDVVCSMIELVADGIPFMERWGVPIVHYNIRNTPKFQSRFPSEISHVKNSDFSKFSTGAFIWKYKNAAYFRYEKLGFPMIKIKYEELIQNPEPVLRKVMDFLDLVWEDSLLRHHNLDHPETDEKGFAIGATDSHKPISAFHFGRYRNELTENQINEINNIAGDLMKSFGYYE